MVARIKREIHIVDNPSAKALIRIDITVPEGRIIDLDAQLLIMPKYHGISIQIDIHYRDQENTISVFAKEKIIEKPH